MVITLMFKPAASSRIDGNSAPAANPLLGHPPLDLLNDLQIQRLGSACEIVIKLCLLIYTVYSVSREEVKPRPPRPRQREGPAWPGGGS